MSLGLTIKMARKNNALSQSELAHRCGVKTITVCFWETDRLVPKLSNIRKLARVLHISVHDLTSFLK